jgi:hypothetical protein
LFTEQYSPRFLEKYKQLGRAQRVLIVDDFHRLNLRHPGARKQFMDTLHGITDRYILIANDQVQQFGELMAGEGLGDPLAELPRYEIQEFGRLARDDLIDKWFSLDPDPTQGVPELSRKVNETYAVLDTIFGKNFVPSYPVFVLSVLQWREAGKPVDISAGTHGYFYELFIRTSLAKMSNAIDCDVKFAYLSFLAYRMFVRQLVEPSVDELQEIHRDYERAYDLPISFERMLSGLKRANILDEVTDGYYEKVPEARPRRNKGALRKCSYSCIGVKFFNTKFAGKWCSAR